LAAGFLPAITPNMVRAKPNVPVMPQAQIQSSLVSESCPSYKVYQNNMKPAANKIMPVRTKLLFICSYFPMRHMALVGHPFLSNGSVCLL
jgi:hypothetical protein